MLQYQVRNTSHLFHIVFPQLKTRRYTDMEYVYYIALLSIAVAILSLLEYYTNRK